MGKRREIPAGVFKARCLALLDEVAETGQEIVVTKRGKPVAKLTAVVPPKPLKGSIRVLGDVISPIDIEWDANK